MSNIEFKTDTIPTPHTGFNERPAPAVLRWIMKISGGGINDEKTASFVAVILFIVVIAIALFLIPKSSNALPKEDMHTMGSKDGEAYYPGISPR